jgi:hypothetical protein
MAAVETRERRSTRVCTHTPVIDGERIYDASGRQIGRADGLRRMQIVIYFYFFM